VFSRSPVFCPGILSAWGATQPELAVSGILGRVEQFFFTNKAVMWFRINSLHFMEVGGNEDPKVRPLVFRLSCGGDCGKSLVLK
jgi:hypothetical protein